jgi:creatinine amidohydrolase
VDGPAPVRRLEGRAAGGATRGTPVDAEHAHPPGHIRPDLVDLDRLGDRHTTALGRFAQGDDAGEATEREGRAIIEASLDAIKELVAGCQPLPDPGDVPFMPLDEAEEIWQRVAARSEEWCTLRP